jgi:hypothetical protein
LINLTYSRDCKEGIKEQEVAIFWRSESLITRMMHSWMNRSWPQRMMRMTVRLQIKLPKMRSTSGLKHRDKLPAIICISLGTLRQRGLRHQMGMEEFSTRIINIKTQLKRK